MPLAARQTEAELAQERGSALADHPLAVRSLALFPRRLGRSIAEVSNSFGRVITRIEEFVGAVAARHVSPAPLLEMGAHFGLPHVQLLVEMGEFSACVFKKDLRLRTNAAAKRLRTVWRGKPESRPILMEQNCLIGNEELQFAEEPKAERHENGDCQEE